MARQHGQARTILNQSISAGDDGESERQDSDDGKGGGGKHQARGDTGDDTGAGIAGVR
jgi:hypothetical protein